MKYLVKVTQYERSHDIGVFSTEANAIEFMESIPKILVERYTIDGHEFIDYSLEREDLDDYYEIDYHGKKVPFTKHMFVPNERITVYAIPLVDMDDDTEGIIDSATQVDAYIVNNDEVSTYIESREIMAKKIFQIGTRLGFENIERILAGSQDGEVMVGSHPDGSTFFVLLEPLEEALNTDAYDAAVEALIKGE